MTRSTRYAVFVLLAGLCLAVGTPVYVAYAVPGMERYLLQPAALAGQAVPYLLCGAIWLPARNPTKGAAALVVGTPMLVAGLVVYGPVLRAPGRMGGDMVALSYVGLALATTLWCIACSAVLLLVQKRMMLTVSWDDEGAAHVDAVTDDDG